MAGRIAGRAETAWSLSTRTCSLRQSVKCRVARAHDISQIGRLAHRLLDFFPDTLRRFRSDVGSNRVYDVGCSTNIQWQEGTVPREAKEHKLQQKGVVLWFTGLSGSGKSTVACTLEHALAKRGKMTTLLDGDNIRHGLNKNLGFSPEDRAENIRRIGEVAKLFSDSGIITLVSFISPYRQDRDAVRARLEGGRFIEIYMNAPVELCEERDPKGLYKKARAGLIKGFTGVDDPYEEPLDAEVVLDAVDSFGRRRCPEEMARQLLCYLEKHGVLEYKPHTMPVPASLHIR